MGKKYTYPDLKCKGFNKDNCEGIVINKKYCLCNNCYSRYYHNNIMSEHRKEEWKEEKRNYMHLRKRGIKFKSNREIFKELGN
jgi:hypothetical protein